jgi:formate--tetrahydrofolate ligase
MSFPSDLEIARGAALKPLEDVADAMGIAPHLLEPHGEEVSPPTIPASTR